MKEVKNITKADLCQVDPEGIANSRFLKSAVRIVASGVLNGQAACKPSLKISNNTIIQKKKRLHKQPQPYQVPLVRISADREKMPSRIRPSISVTHEIKYEVPEAEK